MRPFTKILLAVLVPIFSGVVCRSAENTTDSTGWEVHALGYGYITKSEGNYFVPVVTAEYDMLHLEARYNYEDFRTASLWAGSIFAWDGKVEGFVTPMVGVVFGSTTGISPGLEVGLQWNMFEFYTEGQYFFDLGVRDNSFMYYWTELTATVLPWLEAGVVSQRTRVIRTNDEFVAGPFIGFVGLNSELRLHAFEPGDAENRYFVLSLDVKL
ncbi:MAG: hypothetical protein JSS89_11035 [Bacteroidetes bacterium]|nr:hypothetical protein [Bacteroidota bacterium]